MYCFGLQEIRLVIFSREQKCFRNCVLGDKGKSLETIVLENNDKRLEKTILADKDKGIETTAFKTLEVEG
jgi:hypothetical protein